MSIILFQNRFLGLIFGPQTLCASDQISSYLFMYDISLIASQSQLVLLNKTDYLKQLKTAATFSNQILKFKIEFHNSFSKLYKIVILAPEMKRKIIVKSMLKKPITRTLGRLY